MHLHPGDGQFAARDADLQRIGKRDSGAIACFAGFSLLSVAARIIEIDHRGERREQIAAVGKLADLGRTVDMEPPDQGKAMGNAVR